MNTGCRTEMVIDTSALIAVLFNEPDAFSFEQAIAGDPVRLISAASLVESSIVVEARYGEAGGRELDLLVHKAKLDISRASRSRARGISALRPGATSSRAQFRRLLFLCAVANVRTGATFQGQRLRPNRCTEMAPVAPSTGSLLQRVRLGSLA